MFVATDDTESAVASVMRFAMTTMASAPTRPTLPTTHPARRYRMTPRMVRIDGVKTPMNVPSPLPSTGAERAQACDQCRHRRPSVGFEQVDRVIVAEPTGCGLAAVDPTLPKENGSIDISSFVQAGRPAQRFRV